MTYLASPNPPALPAAFEQPRPARLLLRLTRRTLRQTRRQYRPGHRPLSVRRLEGLLRPNLNRPIFIVGAPRSGTTFLGDCVAALPGVSYHFEPVATKYAARLVYDGTWGFRQAQRFYRGAYGWLMRVHLDADLRFAEKTPRNCFLIPFLHRAFPDAVFLHIVRDGRDAALSLSKQPWLQGAYRASGKREPGGYAYGAARFWVESDRVEEFERTTDVHRCIWAWRRYVEDAVAALAELPPHLHHTVRYEALVFDPSGEAERLLDFLQIDEPVARARFREHIALACPDSVGNWRRELPSEALAHIEREAGALLRKLCYTLRPLT